MSQVRTPEMMIDLLEQYIAESGGVYQAAKKMGITAVYVYDILKGKRIVSERIAAHLGWKRKIVTYYEPDISDEYAIEAAELADRIPIP